MFQVGYGLKSKATMKWCRSRYNFKLGLGWQTSDKSSITFENWFQLFWFAMPYHVYICRSFVFTSLRLHLKYGFSNFDLQCPTMCISAVHLLVFFLGHTLGWGDVSHYCRTHAAAGDMSGERKKLRYSATLRFQNLHTSWHNLSNISSHSFKTWM